MIWFVMPAKSFAQRYPIFFVTAPAPTAVQICPGAVGNLYSLMDQVKTVRAQTRAFSGKLADHLDLASGFEILTDYGNAFRIKV